jgi:hypothetical protein
VSARGPQHETDFSEAIEESRCADVHPQLGRCGFVRDHPRQHGTAVLEDRELALHLWDGGEVRRLEPGFWGMSRSPLPWSPGYVFPEV